MSWPRDPRDGPYPTDHWGWPIIPEEPRPRRIDPNPRQDFEEINPDELKDEKRG